MASLSTLGLLISTILTLCVTMNQIPICYYLSVVLWTTLYELYKLAKKNHFLAFHAL